MHRPRVIPFWPAAIVVCISAVVFALILFGLVRARRDGALRASQLATENRALKQQAQALMQELAAARHGVPAQPQAEPRIELGEKHPFVDAVEQAKQLIQFREKLAAASKTIEAMQTRIEELQASVEKAVDDNKRLAASESDLQEKVAATTRVLEALQTELKGKDDRLRDLETSNKRLRDESRANADKIAQLPRSLRDLDEINRRREGYLTTILRRYRDLTEQYRAMSARLANPREGAVPDTSALGSIQNTISMTEEDLRQLAGLNAQAVRIQQKISGK